MDFSTAPNTAVFYSGRGTGQFAEAFAGERGLMTIADTEGGQYLNSFGDLYAEGSPVTPSEANGLRRYASERYATGASGNVWAFVNNSRQLSIYLTTERPILVQNADVVLQEIASPDSLSPVSNFH